MIEIELDSRCVARPKSGRDRWTSVVERWPDPVQSSKSLTSSLLLLVHAQPLVRAQPPPHALITRNHESTGRRNLRTPRHDARKERARALRLDNMQAERDSRRAVVQRLRGAGGRGGENLSPRLEHVKGLRQQRGHYTAECARSEGNADGGHGNGRLRRGEARFQQLKAGPVDTLLSAFEWSQVNWNLPENGTSRQSVGPRPRQRIETPSAFTSAAMSRAVLA